MTTEFSGKACFVTGAAKGLGRAIAMGLAAAGAKVGIADIDGDTLSTTCEEIKAAGGEVYAYTGDLSSHATFNRIADEFAAAVGGFVDVVINNASLLVYEPITDVTEETLDAMLGAGFKSVVWGTQMLVKYRNPEVTANIINFSSPVAFKGYPNTGIYSAIKGASTGLTKTLAAELGPQNIRVNAIAPGSVPTPGALKYVDEVEYARRIATIPLRRLGHEDDIVNAVKFLLSNEASFINGANLSIDGGIIASC